MQIELKAIQQQVGITFIYVTHDQEEALTMSDRLAVFNRGRIEQVGTPAEVYERPATAFVAGFVGHLEPAQRRRRASHRRPGRACSPSARRRSGSREPGADARRRRGRRCGTHPDVVYLGPDTRYIVALDAGGSWSSPSRTWRHRRWRRSSRTGAARAADLEAPARPAASQERAGGRGPTRRHVPAEIRERSPSRRSSPPVGLASAASTGADHACSATGRRGDGSARPQRDARPRHAAASARARAS